MPDLSATTTTRDQGCVARFALIAALIWLFAAPGTEAAVSDSTLIAQREQFGAQLFRPPEGFVLRQGQRLPDLVWIHPDTVAELVQDPTIETQWFDADFKPATVASHLGRYYVYGEASGPGGSTFRRAITCVCVERDYDLDAVAAEWGPESRTEGGELQVSEDVVHDWKFTELGAVRLVGRIESGGENEPRMGQWYMENATRHVQLKRKVLGRDVKPPVVVQARPVEGDAAPTLRRGSLADAGMTADQARRIAAQLDAWYAAAQQPTSIVIARHGVIVVEKSYGEIDGRPATVNTPMLLHSAMKPLMGIQLGMYVDRGLVDLDEPLGNHLSEFDTESDRMLTFRAGHVHATGIHFPWPVAFSRLFYFRPWQETLIAHRGREWPPGTRRRYGVVGIILSVRALELMSGQNYWDAMEREVFEPLGIRDMLPGGVGFSAEDLARIGVMLHNRGRYGDRELFSEATYEMIVPVQLSTYFPEIDMMYGIGLQDHAGFLGPGSYGHGGGCGTLLSVNPEKRLVFSMVRNAQGDDYKQHRQETMDLIRTVIEDLE